MDYGIDFSELDDYLVLLKQITREQYDDFIFNFLVDMGNLIVAKAKLKTPVDTGALRASWGLGTQSLSSQEVMMYSRYYEHEIPKIKYIRNGSVTTVGKRSGKDMAITITNPQKYATEIENGFMTSFGWYEGRHMLLDAINETIPSLPAYYDVYFDIFKAVNGLR